MEWICNLNEGNKKCIHIFCSTSEMSEQRRVPIRNHGVKPPIIFVMVRVKYCQISFYY
jgi:hypothetical protein